MLASLALSTQTDLGDAPLNNFTMSVPNRGTIGVMSVGPGQGPLAAFGHSALVIRNPISGSWDVFNYGAYNPAEGNLVAKFVSGGLHFTSSKESLLEALNRYSKNGRQVSLQMVEASSTTLNQIIGLQRSYENSRSAAQYDYLKQNCTTHVRDLFDGALEGALRVEANTLHAATYREHILRQLTHHPALGWSLDFALGPAVDKPISGWESLFLPDALQECLRAVARKRPNLVRETSVVATLPVPNVFSMDHFLFASITVALAGFFLFIALRQAQVLRQRLLGVFFTILGLASGGASWLLLWLWLFTPHTVTHYNHNILLCPPWTASLVVLGYQLARNGAPHRVRYWRFVALASLGTSLVALALKLTSYHQSNAAFILLFLPTWGFLAWYAQGLEGKVHVPSQHGKA